MARIRGITISGDDTLFRAFDKLDRAFRTETLADALEEAGEPIRQDAADRAPRRTGELADTMAMTRRKPRRNDEALIQVGPAVFYGLFQEFGFGPGPAQPFLRPAFDGRRAEAEKRAAAEVEAALRKAVRAAR